MTLQKSPALQKTEMERASMSSREEQINAYVKYVVARLKRSGAAVSEEKIRKIRQQAADRIEALAS